ncbi:MAG: hypothetical protein VSS75_028285, partial [Candidatus Parabeggiatoa sp.]|nr:hypothetical protein [Candidatus Parabeggiatoa sp.]
MQYFGNLDRDGLDDFDQDGLSDLEECLQGSDPTFKIPDIIINEVDAQGSETTEFIELYDGGTGNTALDNLVIVLFNGETDQAYQAFDLAGLTTHADGYFVIGGNELTQADISVSESNWLVNDAAAVALYIGKASDFPEGTSVTPIKLRDALVYDTDDADDTGLLALLNPEQPQINEAGGGDPANHSNGRCGEGEPRQTEDYRQAAPSPGAPNHCEADIAMTLTDSADPVNTDAEFSYTLTLNNAGPDIASTLQVVNTLPEGIRFISANGTDWTCNPPVQSENTLTCQLANLAVDVTTTITINVKAPETAGEISNQATLTTTTVDPNEDNNTATEMTTVEIGGPSIPAELETHSVTGNWQPVTLSKPYQTPVVIVGPASSNDLEPGVVRLQQVTPSSFEMRFQEWYYLDGKHAEETLPYVVMEAGRYPMSDGSLWEVGHFTVSGTAQWKDIHFGQAFPGQPRLFLTLQTTKAVVQPVTVRAKDITSNGFAAALFEEETRNDGHPTETVGYVAIYSATGSGTLTTAGQAINYQVQQLELDSATPGTLRLEEEYSLDDETNHVTETVDILTLGDQTFAQIISFNEADTVTVREGFSTPTDDKQLGEQGVVEATHNWQSTSLTGEYQNPVIIVGPASSNDLEPGVVRLQQVTPSSFEMRFQEWYYLDGKHAQETLPYVVMEAGRYPMSDGSLWEVGQFKVSGTGQWKNIHFGQSLPGQPRLFLTLQTTKAVVQPVTVRAKDITSNGFAAALFEEETRNDGHPTETVGYVAI